jgi:hypothetical protein
LLSLLFIIKFSSVLNAAPSFKIESEHATKIGTRKGELGEYDQPSNAEPSLCENISPLKRENRSRQV